MWCILGLEYFSSCCEEMGIDFEKVFCHGEGKTYYSKSKNLKTSNGTNKAVILHNVNIVPVPLIAKL